MNDLQKLKSELSSLYSDKTQIENEISHLKYKRNPFAINENSPEKNQEIDRDIEFKNRQLHQVELKINRKEAEVKKEEERQEEKREQKRQEQKREQAER
ncbi:MAG: hypothetical protein F6K24_39315, partial [Okeania sp. SIO2D1]|nr:hypothetical protein [Okeania sp. SIO2D1]